MKIILEVQC